MNAVELIAILLPSIKKLIATFTDKNLDPDPELEHRLKDLTQLMAQYTLAGLNNSPDAHELFALAQSEAALIDTRMKIKHGIAVNVNIQNAIMGTLELVLNVAVLIK